jgi:hypothetical protein
MYAYCRKCGYDSGDYLDMNELQEAVEKDGGKIEQGENICPSCKEKNTIKFD